MPSKTGSKKPLSLFLPRERPKKREAVFYGLPRDLQVPYFLCVLAHGAVGGEHPRRGGVDEPLAAKGKPVSAVPQSPQTRLPVALEFIEDEVMIRLVPACSVQQRGVELPQLLIGLHRAVNEGVHRPSDPLVGPVDTPGAVGLGGSLQLCFIGDVVQSLAGGLDHDGLQLLGAHDSTDTAAASGTILVVHDGSQQNLLLTGGADDQRCGLPAILVKELLLRVQHVHTLELSGILKGDLAACDLVVDLARLRLGIDEKVFKEGLAGFYGAKRRFEKKGTFGKDASIKLFDDYAHHPQEIVATLTAATHYPHERIVCVFQPHTYTRTKSLLKDFAKALALADVVVMPDIYPARETDTLGVSSKTIADLINKNEEKEGRAPKAFYYPTFGEVETYLLEELKPGDMCITMGAGDVVKVGENLLGI